jgi:glycerol dehydrogenase-like iron-containing ADH family enzyme
MKSRTYRIDRTRRRSHFLGAPLVLVPTTASAATQTDATTVVRLDRRLGSGVVTSNPAASTAR